ncbi:uncharacterized protein H6S33_004094 [Morchella sextelata]|uniref:uncharacterized protein n=1 Tax=Morchella sextelata TaxID=1174677 RepID=UPI001D053C26|nr:uncharacterized protein H6S33_004094 [Morchella sextelata]KAH0606433.1 hypothetical protein H6S33_004094 [Morchella sextelata]
MLPARDESGRVLPDHAASRQTTTVFSVGRLGSTRGLAELGAQRKLDHLVFVSFDEEEIVHNSWPTTWSPHVCGSSDTSSFGSRGRGYPLGVERTVEKEVTNCDFEPKEVRGVWVSQNERRDVIRYISLGREGQQYKQLQSSQRNHKQANSHHHTKQRKHKQQSSPRLSFSISIVENHYEFQQYFIYCFPFVVMKIYIYISQVIATGSKENSNDEKDDSAKNK